VCVSAPVMLRHSRAALAADAPTNSAVSYAALEQDIVGEINLARTRPVEYAA
jgi:hypothetical protein